VFALLGPFLLTIVLGLAIHVLVYYSILLRTLGARSPLRFFRDGADAIVTALSCGSSLATLPVTLRVLRDRHRVSDDSARLAACVGTNLNHDGIILYEAGAAIFVAQAFGLGLGLGQQIAVALAAVMAGIGIAGVPEAGLITLPLVLSAARLPDNVVALVIPLLLPLDWILGRCRAATNVISDMTVAVLLDRVSPRDGAARGPA
jgi:DAACS family dicarboxylate/amino acid:cation (Na+ or H+) symporter